MRKFYRKKESLKEKEVGRVEMGGILHRPDKEHYSSRLK